MFEQKALLQEMGNLQKFAMKLTKNLSDAEDLAQATLLRALEKKHLFKEGTNLFSWTSKIMFNLFVSQYRHKTKFDSKYDPEPHIAQLSVPAAQEASTDLNTVRACMKSMTREHRQVLIMICVRGLRYEDVAQHLEIPVGTVRSRLSRARRQLQEMLESKENYSSMMNSRMPLTARPSAHAAA
jgi:RNA polymerase sigma-70 factor (ECF subfamily)